MNFKFIEDRKTCNKVVEFRGVRVSYKEVVYNKGEGGGVGVVSEEHGGGSLREAVLGKEEDKTELGQEARLGKDKTRRALFDLRFLSSSASSTTSAVAPQNATTPRSTEASTLSSRHSKERSTLRFAFASFFLDAFRSHFNSVVSINNASFSARKRATSATKALLASCLSSLSVWLLSKTSCCLA